MKTVSQNIESSYSALNENERFIVKRILAHVPDIIGMNIDELAAFCLTSRSSLFRTIKKIGYDGYREFRYALRLELENQKSRESMVDYNFSPVEITRDDILATHKLLDSYDFEQITRVIKPNTHLYIYGTGVIQRAAVIEAYRQMKLLLEKVSIIEDYYEFQSLLPNIHKDDVFLCISLSGENDMLEKIIQKLVLKSVHIFGISSSATSTLSSLATLHLSYQITPIVSYQTYRHMETIVPLLMTIDRLSKEILERVCMRNEA